MYTLLYFDIKNAALFVTRPYTWKSTKTAAANGNWRFYRDKTINAVKVIDTRHIDTKYEQVPLMDRIILRPRE